jgi:hypothetical protein
VVYNGDFSELRPTRQFVSADETERAGYGSGTAYTVESEEFHKTEVESSSLTATIVLPRDTSPGPPLVIGPRYGSVLTFRREILTIDDSIRVARLVLDALS